MTRCKGFTLLELLVCIVLLALVGGAISESLRRHRVTHVVEWLGTPGPVVRSRAGWQVVIRGPHFVLWDVTAAT